MSKKLDQNGAVAIISVVIFATIITVLVTAYLRSAVSQQAEAQSYDFSTRAYFTAESGVQDTLRTIKRDPLLQANKSDCTPMSPNTAGTIGVADFGLSYTCQTLTLEPADISGTVEPNKKNALFEIQPKGPVSTPKLVIRWSQQHSDAEDEIVLYPRGGGVSTPIFSQLEDWKVDGEVGTDPIHALLRVAVVTQPRSGGYGRDNITQQVVFMNPTTVANSSGDVDFSNPDTITAAQQQERLFTNAKCYKSDSVDTSANMKAYSCKQTINISSLNFASKRLYLRIGSIYRATGFSVELVDSTGSAVPLQNAQAEIDITAKAGQDTYRRIKQRVPLAGYKTDSDSDAALVAGEGICKLLTLGKIPEAYNSGCNPLE